MVTTVSFLDYIIYQVVTERKNREKPCFICAESKIKVDVKLFVTDIT